MVDEQRIAHTRRYILRPNQSMSWSELKAFFIGLCVVSFSIAGALTLLGYWPVLPFAGLEMLAVGSALYYVARRDERREVISIDGESIRIERGRTGPEERVEFDLHWARVVLESCPKQWYPSRLLIRSHGRAIEVGSFLNENERRYLAQAMGRDLGRAGEGRTHHLSSSFNNDQSFN